MGCEASVSVTGQIALCNSKALTIQLSGKCSFGREWINCLNSGIRGLSYLNSRALERAIMQLKRLKENRVKTMATSLTPWPASSLPLKWQEEETSLKDAFSSLASCDEGYFFQGRFSGLIGTCFWVCCHSFKGFALGKAAFKSTKLKKKERKKVQSQQPVGGFSTRMCTSHVLWSQTGLGWSGGLTERCQAQTQVLHSDRLCCQVGRSKILPHPKSFLNWVVVPKRAAQRGREEEASLLGINYNKGKPLFPI